MIYYSQNRFYDDSLKNIVIPNDAVVISEELHSQLLNNLSGGGTIGSDSNGHPIPVSRPNKTLAELKDEKLERFELVLQRKLNNHIVSLVLGSAYNYPANNEARQHINELIMLGNGGKVVCNKGQRERLFHTHEQLVTLAGEIRQAQDAHMDTFDTIEQEINAATTKAELNAITWN